MDGHAENGATEGTPLLNNKSSESYVQRTRKHLTAPIRRKRADLILLWGYIITGLLDSSAVSIWGSFVSMQTGNTIYLGLGVTAPNESNRWLKALISIGCFCLGSFFFARYHRVLGGKKRWVLITSYVFQVLCILFAALVVTFGDDPTGEEGLHWQVALPLASVAFQSAGQAVTSRVLQYGGLTSVVLTSNYCDLFSDQQLFAGLTQNVERNRRTAAPLLLLGGAVCGGLLGRSSIGMAGTLWTATAMKAIVVGLWAVWPEEKEEESR